jgi:hypothetical protein
MLGRFAACCASALSMPSPNASIPVAVVRNRSRRVIRCLSVGGIGLLLLLLRIDSRTAISFTASASSLYLPSRRSLAEPRDPSKQTRSRRARRKQLTATAAKSPTDMRIAFPTPLPELLLAAVPLERVSILLGHNSIQVTEKLTRHGCANGRNRLRLTLDGLGHKIRSLLEGKGTRRMFGSQAVSPSASDQLQNLLAFTITDRIRGQPHSRAAYSSGKCAAFHSARRDSPGIWAHVYGDTG